MYPCSGAASAPQESHAAAAAAATQAVQGGTAAAAADPQGGTAAVAPAPQGGTAAAAPAPQGGSAAAAADPQGGTAAGQQENIDDCLNIAREGNINAFYSMMERHPHVLDEIDKITFADTPLHVAASAGHALFAMEIMTMKPSFVRKLNKKGFTPLHLALQETSRLALALQEEELASANLASPRVPCPAKVAYRRLRNLVLRFVEFDKELIRVKGKHGLTPLHYVTQVGNLELLVEFLKVCPESILDVTSRQETVLHIALKNDHFAVYNKLVNWIIETSRTQAFLWGLKFIELKDDEDKTISDIIEQKRPFIQLMFRKMNHQIKGAVNRRISLRRLPTGQLKEETRSALLVVVALLITLVFQTILTPPGGTWQDDYRCPANDTSSCADKPSHRVGTAVMGAGPFIALIVLDVISFFFLFDLVLSLLPKDLFSTSCIVPLCGVIACFILAVFVTFPSVEGLSSKILYPVFVGLVIMVFILFSYHFLLPILQAWKYRLFNRSAANSFYV